jgi:ribosome biogenesis SPOUT family RNA methylase Rps3
VNFICLECGISEGIPLENVQFIEGMDIDVDPLSAPQFRCAVCSGAMYPEYYKNSYGYEFRISDKQ